MSIRTVFAIVWGLTAGLLVPRGSAQDTEMVTIPATGTGAIPDRLTAGCGGGDTGAPLDLSFDAGDLDGAGEDLLAVEVDLNFTHTWIGDVTATLIAPNGTPFPLFGRTGSTTTTGCGDSSNTAGLYVFADEAVGDWWAAASAVGGADNMAQGEYRTTTVGQSANGGMPTSLTDAFLGILDIRGTWTLRLTDGGGGDTGSVSSASLFLAYETNGTRFPGAGGGPIPDRMEVGCGPQSGDPVLMTFDVENILGDGSDLESVRIEVDVSHTWVGELSFELIGPDSVTSHLIAARTGATTATGCGDSSDLSGVYEFRDEAPGDFWAAAAGAGGAESVPLGAYRTSAAGGAPSGGSLTAMTTAFSGLNQVNGKWTLRVTDSGGGDAGTLNAASLFIAGLPDRIYRNGFD